MTESGWIWQVFLLMFFVAGLAVMFALVARGADPRRFGPRVYLPRHLSPAQEKRIESFLLMGNTRWAIRVYADLKAPTRAKPPTPSSTGRAMTRPRTAMNLLAGAVVVQTTHR